MSRAADDRPHCLICKIVMVLGLVEPVVPGYELRNFECSRCGNRLRLVAQAMPNADADKVI